MRKMLKKQAVIAMLLLSGYSAAMARESDTTLAQRIKYFTGKFELLLDMAGKNHRDTLNLDKVVNAAYRAMFKEMDPQSAYFTKEEMDRIRDNNKGSTEGIGIEIAPLRDTLTVLTVYKDSPADAAGIRPGDKILFINGEKTTGFTKNNALEKISGEPGTKVDLIIRKSGAGASLTELSVLRDEVNLPGIMSAFVMEDTDIGYIAFSRVSQKAGKEFHDAIISLKNKGMNSLLLDLRGNPGGSLEQVVKMADEILPAGKKITYTEARNPDFKLTYESTAGGLLEDMPVIVLMDKNSASASEILAGVVQDCDRGLVIGETSFGKGSVQKLWNLKDGSGFRITVAEYHTPSGRCIQKLSSGAAEIDPAAALYSDQKTIDAIKKAIESTGGAGKLPVYKTESGRTVIGGGGIFPDHIIKPDTMTLLTRTFIQKGIFFDFCFEYLSAARAGIEKRYGNDYLEFVNKFEVSDSMLEKFKAFALSRNLRNDAMFAADRELTRGYILAFMAHCIWGNEGYYAARTRGDNVVAGAVTFFPEARKILNHDKKD